MKNLRFLFLSMLVMLGMNASAQDAVIDFSGDTDNWGMGTEKVTEAQSYTYNGMTIKLTPSEGNYFRWYISGNILLGKQGATLELPAFDFDVERIDIVGTSTASASVKQNIFVGDEAVSTETTGAKDVTNTYMIAENKQAAGTIYVLKVTSAHNTQITTIKIYGKGANVKQPAGLSWGKTSATVTIGANNNVFPLLDNPNNLPVAYGSSEQTVATIDAQGVITILAAGTTDTTATFDGNDTYEAQTVKYQLTVMDLSNIVEGTCADVIAGADGTFFKVKGTVKSITNSTYGNWIMEDATGEITIYGTLDAEGNSKNFASLGIIEGDIVTVQGAKKTYGETVELVDVTVLEIEHTGTPYEMVGDGSQQNPYTVADVKHMEVPADSNPAEGQALVWVKGIIAGSLNSSGNALLEGENIAASNIALAETANETDGKNMVPVQLATGSVRDALNVLDNPANVGKDVAICGYLLKYMGKTGLKNVSDFILDGQKYSDGIAVMAADKADSALYNLAGQRVEKAVKGLYIQNGRKFVVK